MNNPIFPYSCAGAPVFYNLSKMKLYLLWHYNELDPVGIKTDIMSGLLDLKRKKITDCKFIFKNGNSNEHPYLEKIGDFFHLIYACRDLDKNWSVRLRKSKDLKTWSDEIILVNNTVRRSMPFIYKKDNYNYYLVYTHDCKKLKGILINKIGNIIKEINIFETDEDMLWPFMIFDGRQYRLYYMTWYGNLKLTVSKDFREWSSPVRLLKATTYGEFRPTTIIHNKKLYLFMFDTNTPESLHGRLDIYTSRIEEPYILNHLISLFEEDKIYCAPYANKINNNIGIFYPTITGFKERMLKFAIIRINNTTQ